MVTAGGFAQACDALAASRDVVSLPRSRCGALRKCPANVESCWPFGSAGLAEEEDAFALQKRADLSPRPHFPDVLIVQIAFLRSMTLRLVVWLLRTYNLNRGPRTWRITSNSYVVIILRRYSIKSSSCATDSSLAICLTGND